MRLAVLADVHDNLPALEAVVRDIQKLNVDGVIAAGDYALLTWEDGRWQVEHRAVAYDVTRVRQAFRDRGFLAEGGVFARAYLFSIETGGMWWGIYSRTLIGLPLRLVLRAGMSCRKRFGITLLLLFVGLST